MLQNTLTVIVNGKEYKDMSDSMLMEYFGKECVIFTINGIGGVKGTLMNADSEWVKVQTKKGVQLVNRSMIMNIQIELK